MVAVTTVCCLLYRSQLVSLDVRSTPLEFLQPKLSSLFGESVKMPSYMQNTPMIIRVKDVPAAELREKIAWALNGTWEHGSTGWKLWQTPKQLREDADYYPNLIRKCQKEVLAEAEADFGVLKPLQRSEIIANIRLYANTEDWDVWKKSDLFLKISSPEARFAQAIRKKLPPSFIADATGPIGRTVFSPKPNTFQVQLPFSIHQEYERMIQEKNLWRGILHDVRSDIAKMDETDAEYFAKFASLLGPTIPEFVITVEKSDSAFGCRLLLFRESMKVPINMVLLSSRGYDIDFRGCGNRERQTLEPEVVTKLSKESYLYYSQIQGNGRPDDLRSLQKSLLGDKYFIDPTGLVPNDLFLIAAGDKNVIIVPPLFKNYEFPRINQTTKSAKDMKVQQEADWYVARPEDSGGGHMRRPNVRILTEITREFVLTESFPLESQARFWQSTPESSFELTSWLGIMRDQLGPFFVNDGPSIRIWDSLPTTVRNSKSEPHYRTTFSNCPPKLREAILADILAQNPKFRSNADQEFEVSRLLHTISPDWQFEALVTRHQRLIPTLEDRNGFAVKIVCEPETIGSLQVKVPKTEFESDFAKALAQKVQPVDCLQFEMRLHISPKIMLFWDVTDMNVLPKQVAIGQLSPEVLAKVKAGFREEYFKPVDKDDDEPPPSTSLRP